MNFRTADDMSAILGVKLRKRLGFGMGTKLHMLGMHIEGKVGRDHQMSSLVDNHFCLSSDKFFYMLSHGSLQFRILLRFWSSFSQLKKNNEQIIVHN